AAVEETLKADGSFPEIEREDNKITVYGDADLNRIMRILVTNNLRVRSVNTLEETIEDHYIRLLGRGKIA
ncbi:MAG: hypothetical protein IKR59_08475, partial [Lachnospiraceae bacterium]|nr:hypothetical protein [Lachnospiraceae bacterium]